MSFKPSTTMSTLNRDRADYAYISIPANDNFDDDTKRRSLAARNANRRSQQQVDENRINEICLTCQDNDIQWRERHRDFRRAQIGGITFNVVVLLGALGCTLWLFLFSKFDFVKIFWTHWTTSGVFTDETVLLFAIPFLYAFNWFISVALFLIRIFISCKVESVLRTAQKKKSDKQTSNYLTIYYAQNDFTIETISRLKARLKIRQRLSEARRCFIGFETVVALYMLVCLVGYHVTASVLLKVVQFNVLNTPQRDTLAENAAVHNGTIAFFSHFDCCYFLHSYQQNNTNVVTTLFSDTNCTAETSPIECFAEMDSSMSHLSDVLFLILITTAVLQLVDQLVHFYTLQYSLYRRLIEYMYDAEESLNNNYEYCKESLFKQNMQLIIDAKDGQLYQDYATLNKSPIKKENDYELIPNSTFAY